MVKVSSTYLYQKRRTNTGVQKPLFLKVAHEDVSQNWAQRRTHGYTINLVVVLAIKEEMALLNVDECNSNPCQHTCHDKVNSFTCSCYSCYTKLGTRCELRQCKINNVCYQYETVNPSNSCQKCHSSYKTSWYNVSALSCNDGIACTRNDHCSNGRCIGTPFTCLWCEECYNDACRVKPGYCTINVGGVKTCFRHENLRPGYPCQQCDSNKKHQWTKNNNLRCSDSNLRTKNDRCLNGACVGTPYTCLACESHDGSGCPIKRGYCIINYRGRRTCFANNHYKPGNPCQWCYPRSSISTWSSRYGASCDDNDKCTRGDTCRSGQCKGTGFTCNSDCQYCNGNSCSLKTGFGFANNKCTCKIAGRDYGHQTLNPSNQCQWCDLYDTTARDYSTWSNRPTVPCDDANKCTKQDTCKAGRCVGQGYSCQSSYPSSSCIKTSECVGDGTCRSIMRSYRTICRPAVDVCDQPERCDGVLGTCPGAVTDNVVLKTGSLQMMDSRFQSAITYQYITNRLFLRISGFSVSCGRLNLRWSVLSGTSSCYFNSPVSGTLSDNNVYQTITGLTLHDNTNYKVSVKASDLRDKMHPFFCSNVIVVDTSKPQGGWIRDGPGADMSYQASRLLQVNWGGVQTRHGVDKYEWKVLLTSFNTHQTSELMPFTSSNLNTNAGKTFNNIADGSKARFVIRAYTKAGLFSDFTSDGVVIDASPPVAGKIYDGKQLGVDVKYAKWTSTFTVNWDRFTDPHSPISRYIWAVQRLGAGLITSFKTTALKRSPTATNLNLVSKESYCAVVRGYNEAGLYTQVKSDCVLIDHDAPQAGTVNDGRFSDVDYQSEDTMIAANWNGFVDGNKGSGIVEYKYKIADSSGIIIVPWTSAGTGTYILRKGLALANRKKYFVTVKAIDAVGLDTVVLVTGEDDFMNGTQCVYVPSISSVSVQWVGFFDAHSGILRYDWAIIPSDASPSSSDFNTVPGSNLPTSATFRGLKLTQGRSYFIVIRAYNGAKLFKDAYSVLVIPDFTPPSTGNVFDGPTFEVDVDYQADLTYVSSSWTKFPEPHTAVKWYCYAVGSCLSGNYHVTGNRFVRLDPSKATSFFLTNLTLVNGQRYCIKIKAENQAGLISSEVSSDGFIADVTPPNVRKAQVRDGNTGSDIDYQANTTALSAKWDGFVDPESGIQYYEYGISRNRGGKPNIFSYQNAWLNTSATATGLSLVDDVYYFIVCAVNNARLRKCISSDGVLIDLTLPSHGVVYDGIIEPDLKYQSSLSSMAANWEGIWDLESGVEKFEWSIGTSKNDKTSIQDYTDVGLLTHVRSQTVLNLVSGTKYYVHLKVTNQAGAIRELVSDGVIADGTPPIPSTIYPGFGSQSEWKYNGQENAFYSATASNVAVYWNRFSEPESEVWYYKWAIGTNKCGTQVQALTNIGQSNYANTSTTDLVFRPGVKYYVTVISRNRAGLLSRSCSDALIFDSTPPLPGKVNFGQPSSRNGGKTFINNNSVIIFWDEFTDPESGIRRCNISVLNQAGNVFFSAVMNTSPGNITLPRSIAFLQGEYNVSIKCINNAGLASSSSTVFVIDHTPPNATGPIIAGLSRDHSFQYQSDTSSITASWPSFTDLESGIEKYYFAIGTKPYQDDVVSFEDINLATRITKTDLSLSHGHTYFITVMAKNLAGLNSNVSSLGLAIDTSTPSAESSDVQDGSGDEDIDYFSPNMELSAQWEHITDPESGIIHSEYCLGTKPLGCQIKPMTSTGTNKSFTCPECIIYEGERVFVTVRVTNGALLSKTVTSDGMLLDVSAPVMGPVIDGNQVIGFDYNVVLEDWNISMSWFGVEDTESGVRSCSWSIENTGGIILFQKTVTNNSIYKERNVFSDNQTYKDLQFTRNMTYFNVLTCLNKADLQAFVRSDGFRVEPIWPIPAIVRDGSVPGTDLVYLTNTKNVGANWDPFFADEKDPVVDYEMAIGTAAGTEDVLRFTSVGLKRSVEKDLAPDIPDLDVLETGKMYYVTIKATTSSGLSSVQYSDGFTVDPNPPLKTEVSVSHRVVDQEMETIEISVSWRGVKDEESGISSSGYCLGTTPRACKSGLVPAGASTFGTIGPFRPDPWAEYFVTVVVQNGAGLRTVMSSKKLVFDTSPPSSGTVTDGIDHDIDFMNSTDLLSVQWGGIEDDETGVASCSWSLIEQSISEDRSVFGNDTVVLTRAVKSEGNLTQANLSLVPGARYISEIMCTNFDGFSSTSTSDGVIVDVTSPNAGLVHDGSSLLADVDYQSSTTFVEAVWDPFEDQESGIMEYRWGLGTTPDDTDAMNFTSVGRMTSGKADSVLLTHGVRYYVTVEAANGAGMTSRGWSSGFVVDITPPELTEVTAGSKLWIGPTSGLRASWKSQDLESGIDKTEFCVGTLPVGCQIKSMTEILPNATNVTCSDCRLSHYGTYYLSIRVTNGAGLFTVIATNETRIDLTAPFLGDIIPQFYVTSCVTNCTVVSNITGVQDDESGIRRCSYAIRNSSEFVTEFIDNGLSMTVQAKGLQLQPGQSYYTVVRCENNVGLATESVSSPVIVDNTPPSKGSVIVSEDRTHDVFGIHASCHLFNKTLRAHWYGFNDKESEINGFRVAVGKQPNATDVLQFQEVGLVTNVTLPLTNISTLFDGDIVYVTVESRNGAGLVTQSSSPPTRLIAADSEQYLREGDFYCLNV
ncbi:hypothetical protein ACROYT_G001789 [Oculina patagonica]